MPRNNEAKPKQDKKNTPQGFFDRITLSETLILAVIPFAAYAVVFFYEWGYLSVFKIPLEFISFDLTRIFFVTISIIAFIGISYYFGEVFRNSFGSQPESIKRRINQTIYPVVITFVFMFLTIKDWKLWLFIFFVLLILSLPPFVVPIFTQRKIKGYLAKLMAEDKASDKRAKSETPDPIQKLAVLVGWKAFFGLYIFGFGLFLSYQIGSGSAINQKQFLVVSTSPERVVLWTYKDYVICAPFDTSTKQIDPSFIILNIGSDPNIEYRLEQIGPLKVKKTTTVPTSVISTDSPQITTTLTPSNTITPISPTKNSP